MDFKEMMQSRTDALLAENAQISADCKERVKELGEEITELQKEYAALKADREGLGFFRFKKKRELDGLLEKYAAQIGELKDKKASISANARARIQKNQQILAVVEGEKGGVVEFGTAPYSGGKEPLKWAIISCDNQKMRMICMNTVGLASYGNAKKWLTNEFLDMAFSKQQRSAVDAGVSVPTAGEAEVKGNMHVLPTNALKAYVTREQQAQGARYGYNSLQIQNSIKFNLERCEPYWLETQNLRDGFANYVGQSVDGKTWFAARIGSGAEFGIRPVITVDRFELTSSY